MEKLLTARGRSLFCRCPYSGRQNQKNRSEYQKRAPSGSLTARGLSFRPALSISTPATTGLPQRENNHRFFVPFLEQGITTQVTGNCGACPFGYDKDSKYRDLVGSGIMDMTKIQEDTSTLPPLPPRLKICPLTWCRFTGTRARG